MRGLWLCSSLHPSTAVQGWGVPPGWAICVSCSRAGPGKTEPLKTSKWSGMWSWMFIIASVHPALLLEPQKSTVLVLEELFVQRNPPGHRPESWIMGYSFSFYELPWGLAWAGKASGRGQNYEGLDVSKGQWAWVQSFNWFHLDQEFLEIRWACVFLQTCLNTFEIFKKFSSEIDIFVRPRVWIVKLQRLHSAAAELALLHLLQLEVCSSSLPSRKL